MRSTDINSTSSGFLSLVIVLQVNVQKMKNRHWAKENIYQGFNRMYAGGTRDVMGKLIIKLALHSLAVC